MSPQVAWGNLWGWGPMEAMRAACEALGSLRASPVGIHDIPIVQGRLSGGMEGGAAGGWRAACPTAYGSLFGV